MSLRNAEVANDANHPRDIEASLADAPQWFKDRAREIRNAPNEAAVKAICSRSAKPVEQRSVAPSRRTARDEWAARETRKMLERFPTPESYEATLTDESRTCRKLLRNTLLN